MLRYLIAMVDVGLPIGVLLGFFAAFVRLSDGLGRKSALTRAAFAGALAAAVLVALKKSTGFVVREYYNLAVLLPLLAVEFLLVVCAVRGAWRAGRNGARSTVGYAVGVAAMALWTAYYLPYPLFFPFDFPVGVDSVFSTPFAAKVFGWVCGGGLVALTFLAVRHVTRALSPRAALLFFAAATATMAVSQAVAAAQIGLVRGFLPGSSTLAGLRFNWIGWTIDGVQFAERQGFLAMMAGWGLAAAAAAWIVARRVSLDAPNPALVRKIRAGIRAHRRWSVAASAVLAAGVLAATVGRAHENREVVFDPPLEPAPVDGAVRLAVATISDGRLHRFVYRNPEGTAIRYIVIKKNETAFGVGLDACDVCGPSGYYEREGQVVCILCDVVMNKSTIGFPGGCNPVPLAFKITDGEMRIAVDDLESGAWRFQGDHVFQLPSAPAQ